MTKTGHKPFERRDLFREWPRTTPDGTLPGSMEPDGAPRPGAAGMSCRWAAGLSCAGEVGVMVRCAGRDGTSAPGNGIACTVIPGPPSARPTTGIPTLATWQPLLSIRAQPIYSSPPRRGDVRLGAGARTEDAFGVTLCHGQPSNAPPFYAEFMWFKKLNVIYL